MPGAPPSIFTGRQRAIIERVEATLDDAALNGATLSELMGVGDWLSARMAARFAAAISGKAEDEADQESWRSPSDD